VNAFVRPAKHVFVAIDEIDLSHTIRPYNAAVVAELAQSIRAIGLQTPLTCIVRDGQHVLVAGRNRLEALRTIGAEQAPVRIVDFDDVGARMWTIAENLFRAELTVSQRAEQVAAYARLAAEKRDAEKPVQLAQVSGGRGKEGGDSLASRDLGITREEVRRAKTIAALPEQTKQAARDVGLEDNQSALLKAARAPTPEAQIAVLTEIRERGRVADGAPVPEPDDYRHEPPEEPPPTGSAERTRPAKPLRDLVGISGGELARWIKITTPNDRPHVIRVLQTAVAILRDESEGTSAEEFLRSELANGPRNSFDVEANAASLGLTREDLAQARNKLGVDSRQLPGCPRKWRLPNT
jgi:ParB-like chromosome segregation protein Spo0J